MGVSKCLHYHHNNRCTYHTMCKVQVNISSSIFTHCTLTLSHAHSHILTPTPHHVLGEAENLSLLAVDNHMQDGTGMTLQNLQYMK